MSGSGSGIFLLPKMSPNTWCYVKNLDNVLPEIVCLHNLTNPLIKSLIFKKYGFVVSINSFYSTYFELIPTYYIPTGNIFCQWQHMWNYIAKKVAKHAIYSYVS